MEEKKESNGGMCMWCSGCGNGHHHHHHGMWMILRIVVAIIIVCVVFAIGVKLGELRAYTYQAGYYGYGMYGMHGMMGGYGNGGYAPYGAYPYGGPMMPYYYPTATSTGR